ncbi:vacuolar protein sorting-associated protein vps13 [Anaeramoeba ignava]|uniref:Vacuolar protein sorting-associated protein vps13 n=1 Tax=Anaeramoeba ignava TaxID=1746090 RepID=A0A9Q0RHM2_ANAIG|nr:vacuolar protein sorting-associated protein vps13 [Anaeramoeba ignava]
MFEKIIKIILNTYFNKFIKGFNQDDLKFSIWNGDISLTNIELNPDGFKKSKIPFELKNGFIGNLQIQIPWKHLSSKPTIIIIDKIEMIFTSFLDSKRDSKIQKELIQKEKKEKIERFEIMKKEINSNEEENEDFIKNITKQIINNTQISIENIHIKFEFEDGFEFEIFLDQFSIQSCDSNWNPSIPEIEPKILYKLLTFQNFKICWNSNEVLKIPKGFIKLKLDLNEEKPLIDIQFELIQKLFIQLEQNQLISIIQTSNKFLFNIRRTKFRKYSKPETNPIQNEEKINQKWWKFIFKCASHPLKKEYKKQNQYLIIISTISRNKYIKLWKQKLKLEKGKNKEIEKELQEQINHFEEILNVKDIIFFRKIAEKEYQKTVNEQQKIILKKKKEIQEELSKRNFLIRWFTRIESFEDSDEVKKVQVNLNNEEIIELFNSLGFDNSKKSFSFKFSFLISKGEVVISQLDSESEIYSKISEISFDQALIKFLYSHGYQKIESILKNFTIIDHFTHKTKYPLIISPMQKQDEQENFFESIIEFKKYNNEIDLNMKMKPLKVVYNPILISKFIQFFKKFRKIRTDEIQQFTKNQITIISQKALSYAIQNHKKFKLDIQIGSCLLLFPEKIKQNKDGALFVANLGDLSIKSDPKNLLNSENVDYISQKISDNLKKNDIENIEDNIFDIFEINISKVNSFIYPFEQYYFDQITNKEYQILPDIDISLLLEVSIFPKNINQFDRFKLKGSLPEINLEITSTKWINIQKIIKTLKTKTGAKFPQIIEFNDLKKANIFPNWQKMKINLTIPKISILLQEDEKPENIYNLLKFNLGNLEMNFSQYSFHKNFELKLETFQVEDLYSNQNEFMILSPEKEAFFIKGYQYEESSKNYTGFTYDLQMGFNTLDIYLNQETLCELINFYFKNFANNQEKKKIISTSNSISISSSISSFLNLNDNFEKNDKSFKIVSKINQISITLLTKESSVSKIILENIESNVINLKNEKRIDGSIGNFRLIDLTFIDSKYPDIIKSLDPKRFIKYEIYSNNNNNQDQNKFTNSKIFKIDIHNLQTIILFNFFQEIEEYFGKIIEQSAYFQSEINFESFVTELMIKAKKVQSKINEEKEFLLFDINLHNFDIIIPKHFKSNSFIIGKFKQINFKNNFNFVNEQEISINYFSEFNDLKFEIGKINKKETEYNTIISETSFSFQINHFPFLLQKEVNEKKPKFILSTHFPIIKLVISRKLFEQISKTFTKNNFKEKLKIIQQEIKDIEEKIQDDKKEENKDLNLIKAEFEITFDKIEIEFLHKSSKIEDNIIEFILHEDSFAKLTLEKLKLKDKLFENSKNITDVTISRIKMINSNPNFKGYYREVFGLNKKDLRENINQFEANIFSEQNEIKVVISLISLTFYVNWPIIFDFIHFFIPERIQISNQNENENENLFKKNLHLELFIHNQKIIFFPNLYVKQKKALEIKHNLVFNYKKIISSDDININIIDQDIKVNYLKFETEEKFQKRVIVQPFNFSNQIDIMKKDNKFVLDSSFSNFDATLFTTKDLKMIIQIYFSFIKHFKIFKQKRVIIKIQEEKENDNYNYKKVIDRKENFIFNLQTKGFKIGLIDNHSHSLRTQPLFILDIDKFDLPINGNLETKQINSKLLINFYIDYYNVNVESWENFIEKWNLLFQIDYSFEEKLINMNIISNDNMYCNVSQSFINITKEFIKYLLETISKAKEIKNEKEIKIENENENEIQNEKEIKIENQIENEKEIKIGNKIEKEIKNEKEIKIENQIENEKEIENENENEIKIENKNEIENEIENEKEIKIENQIENQIEIENEIKIEKEIQIEKEIKNEKEIKIENQIENEKEIENENENEIKIEKENENEIKIEKEIQAFNPYWIENQTHELIEWWTHNEITQHSTEPKKLLLKPNEIQAIQITRTKDETKLTSAMQNSIIVNFQFKKYPNRTPYNMFISRIEKRIFICHLNKNTKVKILASVDICEDTSKKLTIKTALHIQLQQMSIPLQLLFWSEKGDYKSSSLIIYPEKEYSIPFEFINKGSISIFALENDQIYIDEEKDENENPIQNQNQIKKVRKFSFRKKKKDENQNENEKVRKFSFRKKKKDENENENEKKKKKDEIKKEKDRKFSFRKIKHKKIEIKEDNNENEQNESKTKINLQKSISLSKLPRNPIIIECQNTKGKNNFYFSVFIKKKIHSQRSCSKIEILPTLIIENVLFSTIQFSIRNQKRKQKNEVIILRGERKSIYNILLEPDCVTFIVGIDGYQNTEQQILDLKSRKSNKQLTILDNQNRLEYFSKENQITKQGIREIAFFSQFVVFNKSGIVLDYITGNEKKWIFEEKNDKDNNDIIVPNVGEILSGKNQYESITEKFSNRVVMINKKEMKTKTNNSEWSQNINLEASGSFKELRMKYLGYYIEIAVSIRGGTDAFKRTSTATFSPRFFIVNQCNFDIEVSTENEDNQIKNKEKQIKSQDYIPLYFWNQKQHLLRMKILINNQLNENNNNNNKDEDEWNWSNPFVVDGIGEFGLKMRSKSGDVYIANILIKDNGPIFYVFVKPETKERPPYLINNQTTFSFIIQQKGTKISEVVEPKNTIRYSWENMTEKKELRFEILEKKLTKERRKKIQEQTIAIFSHKIGLDKLKRYPLIAFGKKWISFSVLNRNSTKVLEIREFLQKESKRRRRIIKDQKRKNNELNDDSNDDEILTGNEVTGLKYNFTVILSGFSISMIDKTPKEIGLMTMQGFGLHIEGDAKGQAFEFRLERFQLDNQNPIAIYPVIIEPKPIKDVNLPVISISIARSFVSGGDVDYYRYVSVLVQALNIKIDEETLEEFFDFFSVMGIMNWIKSKRRSKYLEGKDIVTMIHEEYSEQKKIEDKKEKTKKEQKMKNYFELFHLNPIELDVSFYSCNKKFLNIFGSSLANFEDCELKINGLVLRHAILTNKNFELLIFKHYQHFIKKQLYKIIFSFDIFGDAKGLFKNVGTGFAMFFHEPAKGIVKSPTEFVKGAGKGTWGLVKHSINGIFGTTSKVVGSLGQGVSKLTLDKEFQESRKQDQIRNKPKHIGEGITKGTKSFAKGLWSGVSGLVTQPIKGAKKSGTKGFFQGAGKGLLGVVSKPVVGFADFTSNVFQGIKNTTSIFDIKSFGRVRLPRYFGIDKVLYPFNPDLAKSQFILSTLKDGKYLKESCICLVPRFLQEKTSVIVTGNISFFI